MFEFLCKYLTATPFWCIFNHQALCMHKKPNILFVHVHLTFHVFTLCALWNVHDALLLCIIVAFLHMSSWIYDVWIHKVKWIYGHTTCGVIDPQSYGDMNIIQPMHRNQQLLLPLDKRTISVLGASWTIRSAQGQKPGCCNGPPASSITASGGRHPVTALLLQASEAVRSGLECCPPE